MEPPWWAYSILSLFIFVGLLVLNLIVNKINAARIEERFALVMAKAGSNYPEQVSLKEVDNPANTNHPEHAKVPKECDTRFKTIDATPVSVIDVNVTEPSEVNQYQTIDGTRVNVTAVNEEPREISIIGRNITMEGGTIEGRIMEGSTVEGRTMENSVEPGPDSENTEPTPNK